MGKSVLLLGAVLVLLVVLSGCSSGPSDVEVAASVEAQLSVAQTATVEAVPTNTTTPVPTRTPLPTNTLVPTDTPTPEPTNTPRPTSTPTPAPDPIILEGSGDSVVDVERTDYAAIANIIYSGASNFAVVSWGPTGERIDLLVNTIGSYQGTVPIDLMDDEHTTRFEITASGPWSIEILPIIEARAVFVPGRVEGVGDDVFIIASGAPDKATIDASTATSNFAVLGFGNYRDLLVNEIAPYQGTVIMDPDTILVVVKAEGPWSMEIESR